MVRLIAPASSSLSRASSSPGTERRTRSRVEGRGRWSAERPVLRIPPQRGDLVTLCLDVQAPARLLQVGRDGRHRVAPRPIRPLPAPAGHRSHGLRRHPAQPAPSETAADRGCDTIPATNNAIFNDLFWVHFAYVTADDGIERLRALLQAERHYAPVLAGFEAIDQGRRVLEDGRRPRRPGRGPVISSGRATPSSWSTSSAPWCNPTSIASRVHRPGSSRSARLRASRCAECGMRSRTSPRSTSTR